MSTPTTAAAPERPTPSSLLRPASTFAEWFQKIVDFLLGYSPSGSTLHEQKLTINTTAADIILNDGYTSADDLAISRQGKMVTIEGTLKRTAGNFPGTAEELFTIPGSVKPRGYRRLEHPLYKEAAAGSLNTEITSAGVVNGWAVGTSADTIYFCHTWKLA